MITHQSYCGGFIFFNAWEARGRGVGEDVVIRIVIGGGNFADDRVGLAGPERVIDAGDECDAFAGGKGERFALGDNRPVTRAFDAERYVQNGGARRPGPQLHHDFAAPTDDVFFFYSVGVRGDGLAEAQVDQFFAVFDFVSEIDEHQSVTVEVAAAAIRHIPARLRWKGPTGARENGKGFPVGAVDGGSLHFGNVHLNWFHRAGKSIRVKSASGSPWECCPGRAVWF